MARDAAGNIRVGLISTLSPTNIRFEEIDQVQNPFVDKALESREGRIFRWAAMEMVSAETQHHAEGTTVILSDQRYGLVSRLRTSMFRARAKFDRSGRLISIQRLSPMLEIEFDLREELRLIAVTLFARERAVD